MMTHLKSVFYLICLFSWKMAHMNDLKQTTSVNQQGGFISVNPGDTVTLKCFFNGDAAKYFWYKQKLGEKLQLVSTTYKFDKNGTFQNEFKGDPRFTLDIQSDTNHLNIRDIKISDSGTYYCASGYSFMFEFGDGVTVSVKGSDSNVPALVHQSVSGSIQPGGSVSLNCTVQTATCDGQHSVYWFKDSGEAHPGIIYTHGERNDQCERKPDTRTHTCVYNVQIKHVDRSHAGTYYCAVASCGHILFGNGTKLDFEGQINSSLLVYVLSGAVAFTTILCVLLSFQICKMIKGNCKCSAPSTTNVEDSNDNLHYVALHVNQANRSRRQRNEVFSECVYSGVKL
ncbi:uncharacterized protein LOC114844146 [Betta splendens]|uniref:Uncharacterized protein LOC114844146 n=1 Tax=Betta splendens TaxID=158456 RepID=A0A6P7KXF8_BETSP|nr:uncharacterized protein LOC114844146 [Betta splendens]